MSVVITKGFLPLKAARAASFAAISVLPAPGGPTSTIGFLAGGEKVKIFFIARLSAFCGLLAGSVMAVEMILSLTEAGMRCLSIVSVIISITASGSRLA